MRTLRNGKAQGGENNVHAGHWRINLGGYMAIGMIILFALIVGCEDLSTDSHLRLSPSTVYMSGSNMIVTVFTASGGEGSNYAWALSNDTLGKLSTENATAYYHNNKAMGTNTVTVMDASGNSASSTIIQQAYPRK